MGRKRGGGREQGRGERRRERHGGDDATPALLRLLRKHLDRGQAIVLLSRTNFVPWYVVYDDALNEIQDGIQKFLEQNIEVNVEPGATELLLSRMQELIF